MPSILIYLIQNSAGNHCEASWFEWIGNILRRTPRRVLVRRQ